MLLPILTYLAQRRQHQRRLATVRHLSTMSDHLLSDIGVSRAELSPAARHAFAPIQPARLSQPLGGRPSVF